MLKRLLAMLFLAFITTNILTAAPTASDNPFARKSTYRPSDTLPYIKVLLARNLENPVIEVKGKYRVYNPYNDELLSQGYLGKKYTLQIIRHGLKWGEEFPDIFQLAIVPDNDQSVVSVNGVPYRGILYIYEIDGKLNIVNELPIEEYVKSYLSAHLHQNLQEEALEAVAIVARTNAYYERLNAPNPHWQIDAAEVGFRGYIKPDNYAAIRQAVTATRYLVMRSSNNGELGGIFPAQWTENCAGTTADPSAIFRNDTPPPKKGVNSPIAAANREQSQWSFNVKKAILAEVLNIEGVSSISIFTDSDSGKVYAVRIKGSDESRNMDFFSFQEQIGSEKLASNDFTITDNGDTFTFSGYGKGHGVGLCLYSANQMAKKGSLSPQIVAHFFPSEEIVMMPTLRFAQPFSKESNVKGTRKSSK